MQYTYLMQQHFFLVKSYLRRHFNLTFHHNEIFKTNSMMYNQRYIVIIRFTGSRFNYSFIDFDKQDIVITCQPWNIFLPELEKKLFYNTLKNTSVR